VNVLIYHFIDVLFNYFNVQLYAVGPPIYQLLTIMAIEYMNARMQCDTNLQACVGIFRDKLSLSLMLQSGYWYTKWAKK